MTMDLSFGEGDHIRLDWLNGISVAVNSNIALKSSIRMLFRNVPALEALVLQSPEGVVIGSVDAPKEKIDTNITTSLVITF